ncbi:MAG: hypothetical protein K8S27_09610 [Candidatus Omnitrophica bacterium]|nr:hypothetical protein [Candidatus Omnitrophota bacterium]
MDWYHEEDKLKSVREVVVEIINPRPINPKFGMMMLGEKYHLLRSNTWIAGYFRMDGDPGPYFLLRADGYAARLKGQALRVAHCFYRMHAGGLYAIFIDFPNLKLSGVPSEPFVLFEMIRGIDMEDERQRIFDGINRPKLHICFAEGDGPGEDFGGGMWSGGPIDAQYDVVVDIGEECRNMLEEEWNALLMFHRSLSGSVRDFNASLQQMQMENPLSRNPIIERP